MEQVGTSVLLLECALLLGDVRLDVCNCNQNCKTFQRVWKKYKFKLLLEFPPLSSLYSMLNLQQQRLCSNFNNWEKKLWIDIKH